MNNNNRKHTTPLFRTTNNNETHSSSIFNSSSTHIIPSSPYPSPSLLPPAPQRRSFEVVRVPTPQPPLKSEPTDFLLPPFPSSATPFYHHLTSSSTPSSSQKRPRTIKNVVVPPTSTLARQRRARISDKTRCLQKLLPLERQMDTATLYDQTYKYVKFLEAQITLLQSMPLQIIPTTTNPTAHNRRQNIDDVEEVYRLNTQQLLQVLMSSQVAQTVMYTNGWCVFTAEQLVALYNDRDQQGVVVEQRFI